MEECNYCSKTRPSLNDPIYMNNELVIYITTNKHNLIVEKQDKRNRIKINYCPMCNRKLLKEEK